MPKPFWFKNAIRNFPGSGTRFGSSQVKYDRRIDWTSQLPKPPPPPEFIPYGLTEDQFSNSGALFLWRADIELMSGDGGDHDAPVDIESPQSTTLAGRSPDVSKNNWDLHHKVNIQWEDGTAGNGKYMSFSNAAFNESYTQWDNSSGEDWFNHPHDGSPFTIWIRILSRSITSNPQIILSNRERTSFPGFQFRSGVNSEHAWIMQARDDGGVGQLWNVVSTSVAVTDVWNNIAITSDGSTVSIYVDDMSTAEDTATNISTTTGNPGETLTMGGPPANIGFDHMTAGVMGLGLHDKLLSESDLDGFFTWCQELQ